MNERKKKVEREKERKKKEEREKERKKKEEREKEKGINLLIEMLCNRDSQWHNSIFVM
jgi:hypothetical protein